MTDPVEKKATPDVAPKTTPEPQVKENQPKVDAKKEKAPQTTDQPVAVVEEVLIEPVTVDAGAWPVVGVLMLTLLLSYAIQRLNHHPALRPIRRWLPVAQIIIWCGAVLSIGALTIQHLPIEWFYFELVLLVLLVGTNQTWLRSVLSGAALTLEGKFQKGDTIRLGTLEGEILSFGLRAVQLRATDGTLHDVPNHQLTSSAIANLSGDGGDSACDVIVVVPADLPIAKAMTLAVEAAMLSPLASPRHRPEVFLHSQQDTTHPRKLKVRGYAFDPNYHEHFRSDVTTRILNHFEKAGKD